MNIPFLKPFAAIAVAIASVASMQAADDWSENYKESLAKAKAEKKLLLAEFTGSDWCPPCKKQAAEVFGAQQFKDYAAKNLILVKLDFPNGRTLPAEVKAQNNELKSKFGVNGFPTVIVLDGNEKELGRWVGYGGGGPADLIGKIDAIKK